MSHISPTVVKIETVLNDYNEQLILMECNTCSWKRAVGDAKDLAASHIRKWHGSGSIVGPNYIRPVTQEPQLFDPLM